MPAPFYFGMATKSRAFPASQDSRLTGPVAARPGQPFARTYSSTRAQLCKAILADAGLGHVREGRS